MGHIGLSTYFLLVLIVKGFSIYSRSVVSATSLAAVAEETASYSRVGQLVIDNGLWKGILGILQEGKLIYGARVFFISRIENGML